MWTVINRTLILFLSKLSILVMLVALIFGSRLLPCYCSWNLIYIRTYKMFVL